MVSPEKCPPTPPICGCMPVPHSGHERGLVRLATYQQKAVLQLPVACFLLLLRGLRHGVYLNDVNIHGHRGSLVDPSDLQPPRPSTLTSAEEDSEITTDVGDNMADAPQAHPLLQRVTKQVCCIRIHLFKLDCLRFKDRYWSRKNATSIMLFMWHTSGQVIVRTCAPISEIQAKKGHFWAPK